MWVGISQSRAWIEQKTGKGSICCVCLFGLVWFFSQLQLGHLISSSPALRLRFAPLGPLLLKTSDSDWIILPAFLGLQFADSRLWDYTSSIIPLVNSSFYTYICFIYAQSPIDFVSLEIPNTGIGTKKWQCCCCICPRMWKHFGTG